MDEWRWGRAHPAVFANAILSRIPVLRDLFALAIPSSGGYDTVNRGATAIRNAEAPYANVHGAGLRMIVDMGAPEASRWMIVPGQSGNPLSPHWGDLVRPWRDFEWLRMAGAPAHTLVLAPR
jgi:penicillin amidase